MRSDRFVLMIVTAVLPVLFWTGSSSYDAVKFLALGMAGMFWLLLLAGRSWRRRPEPLLNRPWLVAGGLILLVVLVSSTQAAARPLVWRAAWLFSLTLLVALVTAVTVTTARDLRRLLAIAVAAVTAACLYGLTQMAGWVPGADPTSGFPAGISTLGNQNFLAGLAAAAVWPSLTLWTGHWRWVGLPATAVLLTTVVAAAAAGPLVAVLLAGAILALGLTLIRAGHRRRVPVAVGAVVVALTIASGWFVQDAMHHRPETAGSNVLHRRLFAGNSGAVRRTDWLVAAAMFTASPATGIGAGNYAVRWPEFRARLERDHPELDLAVHTRLAARAHNEYLQAAAELGLVGLVGLTAVLLLGLRAWSDRWRRVRDTRHAGAFLMLSAGLVTVAVHALVSFPLHLPATAMFVALLTGLLTSPAITPAVVPPRRGPVPRLLAPAVVALALVIGVGAVREFHADGLIARGSSMYAAGRIEEAVGPLTRGVASSWWPGQGALYLGLTRQALGQAAAARAHLLASLRSNPTYEGMLAAAEIHIEDGRHRAADSLVAVVLACRPFDTFRYQARYLQGLSTLRQGKRTEARRMFGALLADDPENFRARLALGYLAVLADNRSEAQNHYRQALYLAERKLQVLGRETTAAAVGQRARLTRQRETARKALASVDP
jgi:O-antigen ligase